MNETEEKRNLSIVRNIDTELQRQAKAQAAMDGIPLYAWVNQAIMEKLKRDEGEE